MNLLQLIFGLLDISDSLDDSDAGFRDHLQSIARNLGFLGREYGTITEDELAEAKQRLYESTQAYEDYASTVRGT